MGTQTKNLRAKQCAGDLPTVPHLILSMSHRAIWVSSGSNSTPSS